MGIGGKGKPPERGLRGRGIRDPAERDARLRGGAGPKAAAAASLVDLEFGSAGGDDSAVGVVAGAFGRIFDSEDGAVALDGSAGEAGGDFAADLEVADLPSFVGGRGPASFLAVLPGGGGFGRGGDAAQGGGVGVLGGRGHDAHR